MTDATGSRLQTALREGGRVGFALGLALLVAFALIAAISSEPATALKTLLTGPLSSTRTIGLWVDDAAKLTVAGLAFALVFQARQFSMGVQGQALVGGFCAGAIALSPIGATGVAIPITGIPVRKVQLYSLIATGALCGLAGAQLAMFNYVGFTRDMTSGRGFIALGAVLLGARHPIGAMWAALLFGFFEALSVVLPAKFAFVPPEAINSIPFAVTVLALFLFSYRTKQAKRMAGGGH